MGGERSFLWQRSFSVDFTLACWFAV